MTTSSQAKDQTNTLEGELSYSESHLTNTTEPGPHDVLFGRGKRSSGHTGNRRFDVIINMNWMRYTKATNRLEKTAISEDIVFVVKRSGRFLKFDGEQQAWVEVNDEEARIKVRQALKYREKATKKKRRSRIGLLMQEATLYPDPSAGRNEWPTTDDSMNSSTDHPVSLSVDFNHQGSESDGEISIVTDFSFQGDTVQKMRSKNDNKEMQLDSPSHRPSLFELDTISLDFDINDDETSCFSLTHSSSNFGGQQQRFIPMWPKTLQSASME